MFAVLTEVTLTQLANYDVPTTNARKFIFVISLTFSLFLFLMFYAHKIRTLPTYF